MKSRDYLKNGKKFLEAGLFEQAILLFEKVYAIDPSDEISELIAEAKKGLESTKAEKFPAPPAPAPQIREEAKPFFKALIDGEKCGELNNLAEIGFGLERAHLLCSTESVNLPTGHSLKVKLADDFHIKLGKWALEKTVKLVIVTVGGPQALAAVEAFEEVTGYGDAKKVIETFNTVNILVTDGKGSFFNGVIEFEFSCPTGECKIWRLENKGDSTQLLELPGRYDPLLDKVFAQSEHNSVFIVAVYSSEDVKPKERVPGWIKNNAKWWSEGQIGDSDFTGGIQHLIKEKIIDIPDLPEQASETAEEKVPDWIKNNAGWWADGQIGEDDFVNGIKWLVEQGIIRV